MDKKAVYEEAKCFGELAAESQTEHIIVQVRRKDNNILSALLIFNEDAKLILEWSPPAEHFKYAWFWANITFRRAKRKTPN